MNFKEIREEINSALDYNPDISAYKDQAGRAINRNYLQISGQYQWLFLQELKTFDVRATVEGSATSTVTIAAGNLRLVTANTGVFINAMEGQTFVAPDGSEHGIVRVASSTVLYLTSEVTAATASASWTIRFDRYALPPDCVEVLGVMSRADDRGRLSFVNMRKEEEQFLDKDLTGDPLVMIEEESNESQRPPDQTPTLLVNNSGANNALAADVTYQYCYTIVSQGRESAPSLVAEATTQDSANNQTIRVSNLEDLQWSADGTTYRESGKRKFLYRRDKTNGTRWVLIAKIDAVTDRYIDDTILPTATSGTSTYDYDQIINFYDSGPRQYVRFWWTASADKTLEIRFMQRPRRMSADYDVPAWPVQYHHLLVYKSLEDLCLQHGMTTHSQLYTRRADELLGRMKQKYLSRSDRMFVRRGFDKDLLEAERWGIPTKV